MFSKKEAPEATVTSCLAAAIAYTLFSESARSHSFEEACLYYFLFTYRSATADARRVHVGTSIGLSVRALEAVSGCFPSASDTQNYDYYSGERGERQDRGAKPPLI